MGLYDSLQHRISMCKGVLQGDPGKLQLLARKLMQQQKLMQDGSASHYVVPYCTASHHLTLSYYKPCSKESILFCSSLLCIAVKSTQFAENCQSFLQ